MEVHHHPHLAPSETHAHGKKSWGSYFWEFFMLFLAVFCGFLAENQREHFVEHRREKQYIKSMIEDLQFDTSVLRHQIPELKKHVTMMDTLLSQIYLYIEGKADTRLMYYIYHHYCRNRVDVVLSTRTMDQLRNSGNMRLIRKKDAAEIIQGGEVFFKDIDYQTRGYVQLRENMVDFGLRIFDFKEYQKANISPDGSVNGNEDGFLKFNYQPLLNVTDPVYLKEFAARIGFYRNTIQAYIFTMQNLLTGINDVVNSLKNDYGL